MNKKLFNLTCKDVELALNCGIKANQLPTVYKFLNVPSIKLAKHGSTCISEEGLERLKTARKQSAK